MFQERRLAAWFGLTQEDNLWIFLEREVGTGVDPPRNPSRKADAKQAVQVWNSSCAEGQLGRAWLRMADCSHSTLQSPLRSSEMERAWVVVLVGLLIHTDKNGEAYLTFLLPCGCSPEQMANAGVLEPFCRTL